jgi:ABC-2 type transport system permease protein
MIKSLGNIVNVFKREVHLITHDVNIISVLLLAPIFYSFFYGSIYFNKVETDVPIAVVDMDHSDISTKLTRMLDAHQLISVSEVLPDYNTAKTDLEKGNIQGIVFLPKGFESDLKSGKGADIKAYLNTTKFLVSNDINKAINEVVGTLSMSARLKYFQANGYSYDQAKEMIEPVRLDMRPMFNFTESYGDFLIPAILVLILHQTLLIGLSESIAKEREQKLLPELINYSNRNVFNAINGKGLFYFLLFSSYAFLFFVINFFVFKINFLGNAFALALLTAEMLLAVIYMSIFISSFFKRKIIALQFLTLTSYPLFLMSGYSWPMNSMPWFLQALSNTIPLTPYLNAFVRITQMGAGWNDVFPQIIQLAVQMFIAFIASALRMNVLFNNEQQINISNRG